MGDADYMYAFLNIVMPIAYEFAPEFVFSTFDLSDLHNKLLTYSWIVSAGFDAAAGDTLGNCNVTPACYAHMTALLSTLAGGKLVVALEVNSLSYILTNTLTTSCQLKKGWLQPRLDCQVRSSSDPCPPGRPTSRTSKIRSERNCDRSCVASRSHSEPVLALYPCIEFRT
jgi:acetoin utilization deacetylase AcuC-like enzyme